jgi:hypothetical protein
MAWVRFKADFDWKPKLSVTIGYKAGMALNVPAAAARAAVESGKAVMMEKAHRNAEPVEVEGDS